MTELSAPVSSSPIQSSRRYHGWALVLLAAGLAVGSVAMLADDQTGTNGQATFGVFGTMGVVLYLAVYVSLVAVNWSGFIRAVAAHRWFKSGQTQGYGCIVAFLYLAVIPYVFMLYPFYGVFQYARGYIGQRRQYPLEHRRRIAELESQLGIEPQVSGQCPHCGKPLQVDAEFCSFCGKRARPEVQICPKCGTVALPGATWCARCGSPLQAGDPSD